MGSELSRVEVLKFAHNKSPVCFQCKDRPGQGCLDPTCRDPARVRAHPVGVLISFVGKQGLLPLKDEGQDLRDEKHFPLGS